MAWKGNDPLDVRVPKDIVTGAVARQVPSFLFKEAPDTNRSGLQLCVSLVIYMPVSLGNVNSISANK